jgi:hypothetical protein
MPPFGGMVDSDQALKILAYIRSIYNGDPSKRNW